MTDKKQQSLIQNGEKRYKEIEKQLEKTNKGDFVAIEPKSGDYFVGIMPIDAIDNASKKYPRRKFFIVKIAEKNYLPIR